MATQKFDDLPERFYMTMEHEIKEVQYLDEGFDEVDTNFVGIESLYGKYGSPFS